MTHYKYTTKDGITFGGFRWPLPTEDGPGEWVEVTGELVPCQNGLQVLRTEDLSKWLDTSRTHLWEVQVEGEVVDAGDKLVVRRARLPRLVGTLDERKWRLLACDFAERVLPRWEEKYPDDKRPREAIEVARRYANDEATKEELHVAAVAAHTAAYAIASADYAANAAAYASASASASAANAAAANAAAANAAAYAANASDAAADYAAYASASAANAAAYAAAANAAADYAAADYAAYASASASAANAAAYAAYASASAAYAAADYAAYASERLAQGELVLAAAREVSA